MSLPDLALQKAIYDAITATGTPVFWRVPSDALLPYAVIGQDQIQGDDEAGNFYECRPEIEVYAATLPALKTLVSTIHSALDLPISVEGFSCHEWHFEDVRYFSDDEMVQRAIISFEYVLQRL